MSQIYLGASSTPTVPTSFDADSGSATPAANVLNIVGGDSVSDNDNGIQTSGAGSTITVELSNRYTGTVTTTDATLTTILTVPMGAVAGTIIVLGNVVSFEAANPASAAFSYSGGYRTDGAAATELGTEFHDTFQDPSLTTSDISLAVSGNNILVQVTGIAATTINWNALLEYRIVN